jgi:hypothetical protein
VFARMDAMELRTYVQQSSVGHAPAPGTPHVLSAVSLTPPDDGDFERWFDEEHVPLLQQVPGFLRARRFALATSRYSVGSGPNPPTHFALQEYTSPEVFETEEFKKATTTPWRAQVLAKVKEADRRVFHLWKVIENTLEPPAQEHHEI